MDDSRVAQVADNIMVCISCFYDIHPGGRDSEDIKIRGTRSCVVCASKVKKDDDYRWVKKDVLLKYVEQLPPPGLPG